MPAATDIFNETLDQLCTDAIVNCTGQITGDIAPKQMQHAKRALNRLVKRIDARGQKTWKFVTRTATLVPGTATYTLGADVLDLDDPCVYIKQGNRTVVKAMSRDDYRQLATQTTQGTPNQYFFARTLGGATVTFWPTPDSSGTTMEYVAVLRGLDMVAGNDTPDFPTKWLGCLLYGLTAEIALSYAQPEVAAAMEAKFQVELARVMNDDTERGNVVLSPGYIGGGCE
jgi:hypothetical protein